MTLRGGLALEKQTKFVVGGVVVGVVVAAHGSGTRGGDARLRRVPGAPTPASQFLYSTASMPERVSCYHLLSPAITALVPW
eukprot:4247875-Prymnesium_polylepis.1